MGTSQDHFTLPNFREVEREAETVATDELMSFGPQDPLPASPPAVALALFRDASITTAAIKEAAERRVAHRNPRLHTFVPIFTTNYCDSECKMCAMRKGNDKLERKFSGKKVIEEQLDVLYNCEGVRGVGFLTGEYEDDYTRRTNAFLIGWSIRQALDMGFQRVYFNIGSLRDDEIEVLGEWIEPDDAVSMCVFQETYDREAYGRWMGSEDGIPKSDYDRRVHSFDRWIDAGFMHVNPGVLVGLSEVSEDLVNLVAHVTHLASRGAVVDMSVPRLRPAQGNSNKTRVTDEDYMRMMAALAFACNDQRIVLTTREDREFQDSVLGMIGVISPGSPDVAPYRREGDLPNEEASSQFLIPDLRRPRAILGRIESLGYAIDFFDSPESDRVSV